MAKASGPKKTGQTDEEAGLTVKMSKNAKGVSVRLTKTKAKTPKRPRDEKNGVRRPAPHTQTGKVWVVADMLTSRTEKYATRKDVLSLATGEEYAVNLGTAITQYGKWRRYNGLVSTRKKESDKPQPVPAEVLAEVDKGLDELAALPPTK